MKDTEKLVRDNMPKLCEDEVMKKTPGWSTMRYRLAKDKEEHLELLFKKLNEESTEVRLTKLEPMPKVRRNQLVEELADVLQVMQDIMELSQITMHEVHTVKLKKEEHRGGFLKGIVWDGNK